MSVTKIVAILIVADRLSGRCIELTPSFALSLCLCPATLSAVKSEIRARQSWMAPKHSLGLSGAATLVLGFGFVRTTTATAKATATATATCWLCWGSVRWLCASRQWRRAGSVCCNRVGNRQSQRRVGTSIDSADSRQLQMVCDRDRGGSFRSQIVAALQLE